MADQNQVVLLLVKAAVNCVMQSDRLQLAASGQLKGPAMSKRVVTLECWLDRLPRWSKVRFCHHVCRLSPFIVKDCLANPVWEVLVFSPGQKQKPPELKENARKAPSNLKDSTGSLAVFYVEQVTVNRHVLYFNNPSKTLNAGTGRDQYNYANYRLNVI
jgi:hypothetical protein